MHKNDVHTLLARVKEQSPFMHCFRRQDVNLAYETLELESRDVSPETARTEQPLLLELLAKKEVTTRKHGPPEGTPMRTHTHRMLSLT